MTKSNILKITFHSEKLHTVTDVNVIYPMNYLNDGEIHVGKKALEKLQVLYLIHGGTDDYSCWINNTMLAVFAEKYPQLLIVMPTVYDFHSVLREEDYLGYVSQELPMFIGRHFPVSEKREDTFIAGLSMGGYFAWRIAFSNPERYACVGSFSSPLDIAEDMRLRHMGATDYPSPEEITGNPGRDLFCMIEHCLCQKLPIPEMFQTCGTEDMTYELNDKMRRFLGEKGLTHTYMEWSGGHTWEFWNCSIQKYLAWLPLKKGDVSDG